jgi:hypothetical protein
MIKKNKEVNPPTLRKKLLTVTALIVGIALILSILTSLFYLHERRKHIMKQRATFDVDIIIDNIASPGDIERIELIICGEKRLIEPHKGKDGVVIWGDYISSSKQLLHPEGAPCPVEILITQEGKTKRYPADQLFDCPDCSGLHYYEIVGETAVYRYSP